MGANQGNIRILEINIRILQIQINIRILFFHLLLSDHGNVKEISNELYVIGINNAFS